MHLSHQNTNLEIVDINAVTQHLLNASKLKQEELNRALELQNENGTALGVLLTQLGLVSEKDMVAVFHELTQIPILDDDDFLIMKLIKH